MRLASLRTPPKSGAFTPVRSVSGHSTPSGSSVCSQAGGPAAARISTRRSSSGASTPQCFAPGRRSPSGASSPRPDLFGRDGSLGTVFNARPVANGGVKDAAADPARAPSTCTTCSQPDPLSPGSPASPDPPPVAAPVPPLRLAGGAAPEAESSSPGHRHAGGASESQTPRRRFTLSHVRGRAGELPISPRLRHDADKDERGHGHLCVCEICTCGMHKCHHRPNTARFEGETTSRSVYCAHPLPPQPTPSPRSSEKVHRPQPFQGASTYKRDYDEKPLPERTSAPQPCLKTLPFDGATSYREDFTEKRPQPEPRRQPPPEKPKQPFQGETSYRHFHDEKPLQAGPERERSAPPCKSGGATPRKFEGESSYAQDYREKPLPQPRRAPPASRSQLPFEGESSYKRDYIEKSVPLERPPAPQPRAMLPFYGETSYSYHHGEKPLPEPPSRTRSEPPVPRGPERPFEGASTYRSHYTEQPLPAKPPRTPRSPAPGPDPRDFATTYGQHFVPKDLPVCPITLMPHCPHFAPEGREHNFWHESGSQWC